MKSFCVHQPHKIIADILEPKYSTDEVLISTSKVTEYTENYLIKFVNCNKYPDWYWFSGAHIRKCKTQPNGRGTVYVVSMKDREDFEPITECDHNY